MGCWEAALEKDSVELAFIVLERSMGPNFLIPRTTTDAVWFDVAKEQDVLSRLCICNEECSRVERRG